jgi:hypothetical protein
MAKIIKNGDDMEYYFTTKDEQNGFLVYASDMFKLSEIDIINLIKICLIEARSKSIGKKILSVYRDSTTHRQVVTNERLKLIGIDEQEGTEPIKFKKPNLK